MMLGGNGIPLGLRGKATNAIGVPAGTTYTLPAGNFMVALGQYTSLQWLDPVTGTWRNTGNAPLVNKMVASDGANYRLANLTGCPVGALITTGLATGATTGVGATATAMTVTASSGSSTWCPVVGGAISTTVVTGITGATGVTADTVGAGYLFPPMAIISAPPPGGLQATAHVTGIPTTSALLAAQVIIDNQGAGYALKSTGYAAATCTFINDPRDTTGTGATVRLGLTGTGLLTGLYPLTQGTPLTGVPTLAFGVGGAGATAIMNFAVTTFVSGYTSVVWQTGSSPVLVSTQNTVAGTALWTNPLHEKGITFPRPARIAIATGSDLTVSTAVVEDGGFGIQAVPKLAVIGIYQLTGVSGTVPPTAVVGGVTDTSWLQPI
jgi:hypothetical protein